MRSIWLRHGLETFKKRPGSLEGKVARDRLILTEEQLQALEKATGHSKTKVRRRSRLTYQPPSSPRNVPTFKRFNVSTSWTIVHAETSIHSDRSGT